MHRTIVRKNRCNGKIHRYSDSVRRTVNQVNVEIEITDDRYMILINDTRFFAKAQTGRRPANRKQNVNLDNKKAV